MDPIRYFFFAFVLAMWVVCGLGVSSSEWTGIHWVLLALAHLACAVIFANFVLVFSYGYGISMVLVNAALMTWSPTPAVLLIGGLGMAYGLRLVWFVYARYRSPGYSTNRANGERANSGVPLPLRIFMWISCGWLMAFIAMPAWVVADAPLGTGLLAGGGLMLVGLLLESIADAQKQAAKALNPDKFVTGGLYAGLRHPNYLGEIIFQLGLIVATLSAATNGWALAAGVLGPAYIVILMYYAARNQDKQQGQRYGADPDYQSWRTRTSSLFPGI